MAVEMVRESEARSEDRLTVGVAARLSQYLRVLTQAKKMGQDRISSQEMSEYTNINATQIRRDLSAFGKFGNEFEETSLGKYFLKQRCRRGGILQCFFKRLLVQHAALPLCLPRSLPKRSEFVWQSKRDR